MAADRMNDQHRAAKAAQKECTQLYLLLLLHKQPHVESALVVEIQVGAELW
jgi:DIS3-like exonuclease 1